METVDWAWGRYGRLLPCQLAFVVLLVASTVASAADLHLQRRTALVIGNSDYLELADLPGSVPDAVAVRDLLEKANFDVVFGENLDKQGFEAAIRRFMRGLRGGDAALIYYSGHAVQVGGDNFMLPVDAGLRSTYDLEVETQSLGNLLSYLAKADGVQIAIVDAARENPFGDARFNIGPAQNPLAASRGLAPLAPSGAGLVFFSAEPSQITPAYEAGENPFTKTLVKHGETPNVGLRELVERIKAEVRDLSAGRQQPWDAIAIGDTFYLTRRRPLLIVEAEHEIVAPAGATSVELELAPPVATGDLEPTVTFTALPKTGQVFVGGNPVSEGDMVPGADIAASTFHPAEGQQGKVTIAYTAASADGTSASTSVTILLEGDVSPSLAILAGDREESPPTGSIRIAFATQTGDDFAAVSVDADTLEPSVEWLRVESRDPQLQLAVGDELLAPGDLMRVSEMAQLRIRPTLAIAEGAAEVRLTPAIKPSTPAGNVTIAVSVDINDCDRLAGEPFDLQGVTEGRLPNEIDIPAATAACRGAVKDYPDTPRFRFQLARALYATGAFDEAAADLRKAYGDGHIRAGQLLARLYQLGAGVERDPTAAIPYFEDGAARGDAYAQNWLAKALLDGNGVAKDPERAVELYARAAEAGHTYAMNGLGAAYLYGRGVTRNPARALRFFQASAARQDVWGYVNLGVMYRDGEAVDKDPAKAREYFLQAHEGGHPYAATALGLMARDSGASAAEQLAWFRQSADRGDAWGALHAAELLQDKGELAGDEGERVRLLALASSHEVKRVNERAEPALKAIDRRLLGAEIQRALARLGADVGDIDGLVGPATREAASRLLGAEAPTALEPLLVALLHKEWLDARPRLDML